MDNNAQLSSGIGFMGALQILLIGLKLGHVIDWAWWKVLLPLELDVVVGAAIIAVYVVMARKKF